MNVQHRKRTLNDNYDRLKYQGIVKGSYQNRLQFNERKEFKTLLNIVKTNV